MTALLASARPSARRRLSPPAAYVLAASVIGLALFASATPSPLYGIYRAMWGFTPVVLTLVYATYAFGVLISLIVAGHVSDDIGRRPVLLLALGALMLSTGLFMAADSVGWLFAARGLQGLATGLALSAASAALLDLHPRRDAGAVGLTNGVVSAAGMGLGVLASAAIVELLPAPRILPYVLLLVLFGACFAAAWWMPEPVTSRSPLRLSPQRLNVPAVVRGPFILAALAVISSWSVGGLFLSLGPQLSASLFHTSNHLVTAISVFALAGTGAVAQLTFARTVPWAGAAAGSIALAIGMLLIVAAATTASSGLLLLGALIAGAGFGVAFLGALRTLSAVIPAEHRASVMSAFYLVAYASLSLPAVLAGAVVTTLGLRPTFEIFGVAVATIALAVTVQAWRVRPRPAMDA
ncbi:MAG: MFS transporter [Pseudonocardiales bacterium]|nr:MAG: MFS transporter [Pseudonocardiales bacterium]